MNDLYFYFSLTSLKSYVQKLCRLLFLLQLDYPHHHPSVVVMNCVQRLSSDSQPLTSKFIYLSFSPSFVYVLHYWLEDMIREIYHFPSHKHLCNYIPEMSFFVQTKLAFGRHIIGANVSFWSNCKKGNRKAEIEITNIAI